MTNFLDPRLPGRFWERRVPCPMSGCWLWIGSVNNKEYATCTPIRSSGSTTAYAHRLAYLILVGPVPAPLELDHKCRTTVCVNPDHLEPVTHAVNIRRGRSAQLNLAITHCPRGHAYNKQNTTLYRGRRFCKACSAIAKREYKKRARAGTPSKKQLIATIASLCDLVRQLVAPITNSETKEK